MEPKQPAEESAAPSNIVINGQEYSPKDAQSFIELGKKTREYEQKWNTSLDRVWPEYGKLSQERTQWQSEKQKYESQLSEFQQKQQQGTETPADIQQAREAARKLGIVLDEDVKGKYLTKDELENWYTERRTKEKSEESAVQTLLSEADKLAEEINASDAPAKFNKKAVLAYANAYGIRDLRAAYEEMHEDVLKAWKAEKLSQSTKKGLQTLKPGGKKEPVESRPKNEEDFKSRLHESLWGSDQGK